MNHYVVLDTLGLPAQFYNDDIYPPNADGSPNVAIPSNVVTLTEAQWQQCINANGSLRVVVAGDNTVSLQAYAPPTGPPLVPEAISERQFMQQLAVQGDITWDECFAYLGQGAIPSIFANAIAQIPTTQDPNAQNKAKAAFIGANSFDRHNSMTIALGQIIGWSSDQLDALWTAAIAIQ